MKSQKYYCAWHPEKGYKLNTADENYEAVVFELHSHLNGAVSIRELLSSGVSQGWQVKEVVIVDADEFDKLTMEA